MSSAPRLPVTVLSGFLGAGETTLLNAVLRSRAGHEPFPEFRPEPSDASLMEARP